MIWYLLLRGPVHAVDEVVVHLAGPLPVGEVDELLFMLLC
jgi:hypothetical protein